MADARPWRADGEGVRLAVRLTPRGGRAAIDGCVDVGGRPVLQVRVAEPPVDGAANTALIRLVAKASGLPASAVTVASGAGSRIKTLRLAGTPGPIVAALDEAARRG